jgi:mannose-1-phosphate guanylyltransferase
MIDGETAQMSEFGMIDRNGTRDFLLANQDSVRSKYAAVILAGGDGVRLSSFTRKVYGYHLPKQFCPLFEGETLLEQTMRRVSLIVPPEQTMTVLNRAHERFYAPILGGSTSSAHLVQPDNRGTAPALVCALRRLIERGHLGAVAIFPSDHYVSNDSVLMRHVSEALRAVEISSRLTVLLGITPDGPETEYGWIEPGTPVMGGHPVLGQINRIQHFWEKPSIDIAQDLYGRNCLWNSFILVANTLTLLSMIARALPEMYREFSRFDSLSDAGSEQEDLEAIFGNLPSLDFSSNVVARFPSEFSVLPVTGVIWSDLGEPRRLLAAISSGGSQSQRDRIFGGNQHVPTIQSLTNRSIPERNGRSKATQDRR